MRYEGHMKRPRQENDLRLLIHNLRGSAVLATSDAPPRSVPTSDEWLVWIVIGCGIFVLLVILAFALLSQSLQPS